MSSRYAGRKIRVVNIIKIRLRVNRIPMLAPPGVIDKRETTKAHYGGKTTEQHTTGFARLKNMFSVITMLQSSAALRIIFAAIDFRFLATKKSQGFRS